MISNKILSGIYTDKFIKLPIKPLQRTNRKLMIYQQADKKINKPIDIKKNVMLGGVFFGSLYQYTIIRDVKDVMLISSCGVDAIPFLKTWINFPLSIIFLYLYQFISKKTDNKKLYQLFYGSVSALYIILGLFLYPYRIEIMNYTNIPMFDKLVVCIFYCMSSVWGSVIVSLLFWSLANRYTALSHAKIVYPIFGLIANFALIISGLTIKFVSSLPISWNQNIMVLTGSCILSNIFVFTLHNYIENNYSIVKNDNTNKKDRELSFIEGIQYTIKNKKICYLVIMVTCYGLIINLFEVIWKVHMKMFFITNSDFSNFLGSVSITKGCITIFMMLFSTWLLPKTKWIYATLITPFIMLILNCLFFYNIIFNTSSFTPGLTDFNNGLYLIVIIGAMVAIFSKSSKYSLFDPCKEIVYIPMSSKEQNLGKSTVDVIANPLGKSGGSFLQQMMIFFNGSILHSSMQLCIIMISSILLWTFSVFNLNKYIDV